jgi:hypothetical protein
MPVSVTPAVLVAPAVFSGDKQNTGGAAAGVTAGTGRI